MSILRSTFRVTAIFSWIAVAGLLLNLVGHTKHRARLTQKIYRIALWIAGIKIDFKFANIVTATDDRPKLILSNHVSYLDVIVIGALFPTAFLAKKEVSTWPLIGRCARAMGCLFVDRGTLSKRVITLKTMARHLALENLSVFPEGTTTSGLTPSLSEWKAGNLWAAQKNRSELCLLGLVYESQKDFAWIDDMGLISHLFQVLKRKRSKVYVTAQSKELSQFTDLRTQAGLFHSSVSHLCQLSQLRYTTATSLEPSRRISDASTQVAAR